MLFKEADLKNLFPLLIVAILFAGCEKIEGLLTVTNDITLVSSNDVKRTIRPGSYDADIKILSSNKVRLRLNNDSDEKYTFNVPKGIPDNGAFSYKSATIGQPVDISGVMETKVTDSSSRRTTQNCQFQEAVQVCYPSPGGGVTCSIQHQTRFGTQWIEYFDRSVERDVTLSIAAAGSTDESAQFVGANSWVDRIVTSSTRCM